MTLGPRALTYRAAVVIMGISGLVAEMSLLRELLIVAAGNEMTIGIILANWLVIEAAGAAIGGRLRDRFLRRTSLFALFTGLLCLSLPLALYAVRVLKPTLGLSVGEIPGLGFLFTSTFLILLPTSFTHGALFPMACGVAPRSGSFRGSLIGGVYLLETAGTLVGGMLWTWFLIPYLHSFEIACGVAVLNGAICLGLLLTGGSSLETEGRLGLVGVAISAFVLLGGTALLVTGGAERLHLGAVARQWRGQRVVDYRNSVHGNLAVTENQGQYSFFTDGTLALMTPYPDTAHVSTYAHVPLTAHPDPRRVLLIAGGPGGQIREMLRHPDLSRLDYAELDPLLIELLRLHPTHLTRTELGSPRVSVKLTDGRSHLMRSSEQYDVIVSMLAEPSDLQTNRFFTIEFLELAARRLGSHGILVNRLPATLGLHNEELVDLVASLYQSMASVFPNVRLFPGESDTMAIASMSPAIMDYDAEVLVERLAERGMLQDVALPWAIERRLHPGWQEWFLDLAGRGTTQENRDFAPYAVFLSLSYWNSLHAPALGPLFRLLRRIHPWMIAGILGLIAAGAAVLRLTAGRGAHLAVGPCVFGTGFAGMLFTLSLSFSFQSLFGYLFSWIGLLTAAFMAGSAAGALFITRHLTRTSNARRQMVLSEAAVLIAAALLPVAVPRIAPLLETTDAFAVFPALFLLLPFACGVLTGAQFPLASQLREDETGRTADTAGTLYAADLIGGWLGGMLGGVFLIPVLGLGGTGLVIALLKLLTLTLFGLSMLGRPGA